jgi:trehalose synthase-fused probable maltokinase
MRRNVLEGAVRARFEAGLPLLLKAQRWFGGKARELTAAHIIDSVPIPYGDDGATLLFIGVTYADGAREIYLLPVASAFGAEAGRISHERPGAVLAHVAADDARGEERGVLYDAMWDSAVLHVLVRAMEQGARFAGQTGHLQASSTAAYKAMVGSDEPLSSRLLSTQQSNTTVAFGQEAVLKLYRRLQAGINPDWEIGRYLTTHGFSHSPAVGGALEYVTASERTTVALLQSYVPNEGDAWTAALKQLEGFLGRVGTQTSRGDSNAGQDRSPWDLAQSAVPDAARHLIGPALDAASCLARRTAALHRTLGQAQDDPDFAPEPLTAEHRQARHRSMTDMWKQAARLLGQRSFTAPAMRQEAEQLLAHESTVLAVFETLLDMPEGGRRIRCHGDYHLGQVLWTGSDYVVTDFEGEPARPLQERRVKQSPLYDVAGMLRSFDYASWTALGNRPPNDQRDLEPWARYWSRWVRACFLGEYLTQMKEAALLPPSPHDAARLLTVYQLEKAVYELGYELNNRPDWVAIPMKGINEIAHASGAKTAA